MSVSPVLPLRDTLSTASSRAHDRTIQECLPLLTGLTPACPALDRPRHIAFLHKSLRTLPAPYVAADAARPWMLYWAMAGRVTLGDGIDDDDRARLVNTVRPMQNSTGGFGGGHGQMSHLATTYAILLAVTTAGAHEALQYIDRRSMWLWLSQLKMADGGFQMSRGGEEDIRGAYCAAVIITLLHLPVDLSPDAPARAHGRTTFFDGLPQWIARCQTYEGGISGKPDAEAHGAYAFCALACLCILGEPQEMIPQYLDLPLLLSWLSSRHSAPEGGLSGRTNKLVDGCYSHWVGGCWPLLEACLPHLQTSLYDRQALIRYILCCCQDQTKRGGLRDKPSTTSDGYHTCYVLAGLGFAQHKWHFRAGSREDGALPASFAWTAEAYHFDTPVCDEARVGTLHPVFVVPEGAAERVWEYCRQTRF